GRRVAWRVDPPTLDEHPRATLLLPAMVTPLLAGALALPVAALPHPPAILPFPVAGHPDEAAALADTLRPRGRWRLARPRVRHGGRSSTVIANTRLCGCIREREQRTARETGRYKP